MSLSLTTLSRPAFQSMTQGLRAIDRYYRGRDIADIERAAESVDDALNKDANYGLAIFYKGVVLDLIGKPADAPGYFDRILRECESPKLKIESTFNLGVVNYHQYSHPYLARAEEYFSAVISSGSDAALKNLARAHLAQTYAMWMRPSPDQLPDKRQPVTDEVAGHIRGYFQACQALVKELRGEESKLNRLLARLRGEKGKLNRLIATYENANGMSQMYYTDHIGLDSDSKQRHLESARDSLLKADQQLPRDWANTCDMGSLQLRWGVLRRQDPRAGDPSEAHFEEGRERLVSVVETLRPGYGFALYELGVLHRVWGKWSDARRYLEQARDVPVQYRDIADAEISEQMGRVEGQDKSFP